MTEEKKPTKTHVPKAPKTAKVLKDIVKIAEESGDDLAHLVPKKIEVKAQPKTIDEVFATRPVANPVSKYNFDVWADIERQNARVRGVTVIVGALYPATVKGRSKRGWTTPRATV